MGNQAGLVFGYGRTSLGGSRTDWQSVLLFGYGRTSLGGSRTDWQSVLLFGRIGNPSYVTMVLQRYGNDSGKRLVSNVLLEPVHRFMDPGHDGGTDPGG